MKREIWNINNRYWAVIYFDEIDSTQKYLINNLNRFNLPVCIWSENQTGGIGTKNRKWEGNKGNLFFSFAINQAEFDFVPMQSLSVYFSYILYDVLKKYNQNVTIKWPNDIYILEETPKKIAGILTNIKNKKIICGIGINTEFDPNIIADSYKSGCLCIKGKNDKILKEFLSLLVNKYSWEYVFENYSKIFAKNKSVFGINGILNNDATIKG